MTKLKSCIIIFLFIINFFTQQIYTYEFPAWLGGNENTTTMGILCEPENDEIGRKLGCTCKYPFNTPATDLIANCQSQTIGTEDTQLPYYLNISRHVRTLNFNKNQLLFINNLTFGNVDGITELILSNNLIHRIDDLNFPRLSKLDLSHNLITNLTNNSFNLSTKLQEINLSFNHLTFIDTDVFYHLKFLKILNFESNHIGLSVEYYDEYPFKLSHLQYLIELNFNNNSLEDFPINILEGTFNLKKLYLKNNKLFSIPKISLFEQWDNLNELDLSGNYFNIISSNEFNGFKNLKKLWIDGNKQLTMIEPYGFSGLISLKELSCQMNHKLTFIDPLAFRNDPDVIGSDEQEPSPKIVRLGNNALAYIEFPLLVWKDLEELDLIRNPWICDCNLQWVPTYRNHKMAEAAILIDSDFVCHGPGPLKGMIVAKVDPNEMLCFSETISAVGIIGIIIFGFILTVFCIFIGLSAFGLLPNWIKKYNIFKSDSIPKYSRVHPKPQGRRNVGDDVEKPADLEWDTGDIGVKS